MGFFDRFRGGKEGVYPDAEFSAPKEDEEKRVDSPENTSDTQTEQEAEMDLTKENPSLVSNKDDAETEARYINRKYGDTLKSYGEVIGHAERFGDKETSEEYKQRIADSEEAIDKELAGLDQLVIEAAKKNVGLQTFYGRQDSKGYGEYLWKYLQDLDKKAIENREFDPESDGNFGFDKLQYVAGKLNTKVQNLKEKQAKGDYFTYPVVKLSESGKDITFITNGNGIYGDNRMRVFKMDNENMKKNGYELEDID